MNQVQSRRDDTGQEYPEDSATVSAAFHNSHINRDSSRLHLCSDKLDTGDPAVALWHRLTPKENLDALIKDECGDTTAQQTTDPHSETDYAVVTVPQPDNSRHGETPWYAINMHCGT